jgi:hypothetical protein
MLELKVHLEILDELLPGRAAADDDHVVDVDRRRDEVLAAALAEHPWAQPASLEAVRRHLAAEVLRPQGGSHPQSVQGPLKDPCLTPGPVARGRVTATRSFSGRSA